MTLANFAPAEKLNCFWKTVLTKLYWNQGNTQFWLAGSANTSSSYVTVTGAPTVFTYHRNGQVLNPSNLNTEMCLYGSVSQASYDSAAITYAVDTCGISRRFACEAPLSRNLFPPCPACTANTTRVAAINPFVRMVNDSTPYNTVVFEISKKLFKTCNKTYLAIEISVDWFQTLQWCCELGFIPLMLDNAQKLCLANPSTSKLPFGRYWSGGTNQGPLNENSYGWCGSSNKSLITDSSLWHPGQPNLPWSERCIMFIYDAPNAMAMHDYECETLAYPLCQLI
ncbi:Hypothetical predicted protein [Cloeon dipterum]|uniref:C-type lectin domain-containing protein n=1 Tax=Cloeon dipterum TaxID=197152 RepID=A0A8S1C8H1_9INSE|nr:Hypothetical predicted protein [Cloeon dipterum]